MGFEIDPLVTTVIDTFFDGLDEPLDAVKALTAKTDIDFINEAGTFDPKLKVENANAISGAIKDYNAVVRARGIASAALQAGLQPVTAVALAYEVNRSVAVTDWRYIGSRSQYDEPIPTMPNLAEQARPKLMSTVVTVNEANAWWTCGDPYFLRYEVTDTGNAVTAMPSRGIGNVKTDVNNKASSWDTSPGSIYSEFEGGVRVALTGKEDHIQWIGVDDKPNKFTWPILGYYRGIHTTPEHFLSIHYNGFAFLGEQSHDTIDRDDTERFAARIAIGILRANNDYILPVADLPTPSDEFSESIVDLLANSTVAAFLPPKMTSFVQDSRMGLIGYEVEGVTTHEVKNLIKASTEQELKMYLGAVGAQIVDLAAATDTLLAKRYESKQLGGRIDVIKARDNIDTFFSSLA